jgi:hypothetical protein
MSRLRRSPIGALAIAVAVAGALAAAPAAASGNVDPKSHRAPQSVSASDVKKKTGEAMPGPHRPGWVERLIGSLKPRPPKHVCRG